MDVPRRIDLAGPLDRAIGGERLLHEGPHALLAGGLALDGFEHEAMGRATGLLRDPGHAGPEFAGKHSPRMMGGGAIGNMMNSAVASPG